MKKLKIDGKRGDESGVSDKEKKIGENARRSRLGIDVVKSDKKLGGVVVFS